MRSRYRVLGTPEAAYFVTSSIVRWLPVFTTSACCDILVASLAHCRLHKGLRVYGWVIMDHHFHAVLAAPALSQMMADLKKFTARQLLAQLPLEGRDWLLDLLARSRLAHKTHSDHQVWQEGFHPQEIADDAMMEQKLDYLHNNPVERGWVAAPEHWRYSSAHGWLTGPRGKLPVDPWR